MANFQKLILRAIVSSVSEYSKKESAESGSTHSARQAELQQDKDRAASSASASKRRLVGAVAAIFLLAAALGHWSDALKNWTGSASTSDFLVSAATRVGMVFSAMWLAWDSLRRPARWLPPGLAVIGVISIVAVAAQPKLLLAILPLAGTIAIFTSLLRVFRRD